ncbi:MAG: heparin lyase I family protein [Bacteroidota bacterium]
MRTEKWMVVIALVIGHWSTVTAQVPFAFMHSQRNSSHIIHGSGTFESGTLKGFYRPGSNDAYTVTDTVRRGLRAAIFELHKTDSITKVRTQAIVSRTDTTGWDVDNNPFHFKRDSVYWVAFDVYVPSNWVFDRVGWEDIIYETQPYPDPCDTNASGEPVYRSPDLSLEIDSLYEQWIGRGDTRSCTGDNTYTKYYTNDSVFYRAPMTVGAWTRWVVRVKYNYNATGELKVWRNGVVIVDRTGLRLGSNDTKGSFGSLGEYKPGFGTGTGYPGSVTFRRIYLDHFRIGNSTSTYNIMAY